MTLNELLQKMWEDYTQLNPSARAIFESLTSEGEIVENDHIALRTFKHPKLGINSLAIQFIEFGYEEKGQYLFSEKKLFAKHYEHSDPTKPKVFISELELEKMSSFVQTTINTCIESIPDAIIKSDIFPIFGRPWDISYQTYCELAKESEYASWVAAFGFRPNHFTVNINKLNGFKDIRKLNQFILNLGYRLNMSGGEVKGTPAEYLEQSSTMAMEIPVRFSDGIYNIPGCYYEFAKRYELSNGKLYQGFIAQSADKIFESTNRIQI